MTKKLLLALFLFLIVVAASIVFTFVELQVSGHSDQGLARIEMGSATFLAEVADTISTQTKGLSGRESLDKDRGMLFLFDAAGLHSFWMKDMRFPLDIIWLRDDRVVGFVENAPPIDGGPLPIYMSPEPVDKVLEVNAGMIRAVGIRVGDSIKLVIE